MAKDQITSSEWMLQPLEVKMALVSIFGVPKTGFAQTVTDATGHSNFITDGYTHKDLSVITFDRLLSYLGEAKPEDNVHSLFLKAVEKIQTPIPVVMLEDVKFERVEEEKVKYLNIINSETRQPLHEDPGPDGFACEFCAYKTANNRAMHMHRIAKHLNR